MTFVRLASNEWPRRIWPPMPLDMSGESGCCKVDLRLCWPTLSLVAANSAAPGQEFRREGADAAQPHHKHSRSLENVKTVCAY